MTIPEDAEVIVCVSRLRPEKAHRNLLQAVANLRKIKNDFEGPQSGVGWGRSRARGNC